MTDNRMTFRKGGETVSMSIAPRDLIPEEDRNRLIHLRDIETAVYWQVGDIANRLISMGKAQDFDFSLPRDQLRRYGQDEGNLIYIGVGFWYGRSARTVRYYAEVARFFPAGLCHTCGSVLSPIANSEQQYCPRCEEVSWDIRKEYEQLPFAFFVVARKFGVHWKDFLSFAADNPQLDRWSAARMFIESGEDKPRVLLPASQALAPGEVNIIRQTLPASTGEAGGAEPEFVGERLKPDRVLPARTLGELVVDVRRLEGVLERTAGHLSDTLSKDTLDSLYGAVDALERAAELLERDIGA